MSERREPVRYRVLELINNSQQEHKGNHYLISIDIDDIIPLFFSAFNDQFEKPNTGKVGSSEYLNICLHLSGLFNPLLRVWISYKNTLLHVL